jgi:hypothetical protein
MTERVLERRAQRRLAVLRHVEPRGLEPLTPCLQSDGMRRDEHR